MTNPYETPPPGWVPPPGWGGAPRPPQRKWWHAPGSLIGAATFSATFSWLAIAIIAAGYVFLPKLEPDSFEEWLLFIIFGLWVVLILFAVGLVSFWLAIAGALATVPLAIAWSRGHDRSPAALAALSTAVVSWLILGYLVVHLGLYQEVF